VLRGGKFVSKKKQGGKREKAKWKSGQCGQCLKEETKFPCNSAGKKNLKQGREPLAVTIAKVKMIETSHRIKPFTGRDDGGEGKGTQLKKYYHAEVG